MTLNLLTTGATAFSGNCTVLNVVDLFRGTLVFGVVLLVLLGTSEESSFLDYFLGGEAA